MSETKEIEDEIARRLNEDNQVALDLIEKIIATIGVKKALEFLDETMKVEEKGGISYKKKGSDEEVRRTPGGVFFHLVRGGISKRDHEEIWPEHNYPFKFKAPKKKPAPPAPQRSQQRGGYNKERSGRGYNKERSSGGYNKERSSGGGYNKERSSSSGYKERGSSNRSGSWTGQQREVLSRNPRKGSSATVTIKIVGRPGKIIDRDDYIITPITNTGGPELPFGLPVPPASPTIYLVYISRPQWEDVRDAIEDPDEKLVIEGYPYYDKKLAVVSIMALDTTTSSLHETLEDLL